MARRDMAYLYGDPLPGYPAYPDRGSLTFRYRWFFREFLEPGGMVIPLVISEAGIDGIIGNRPGPPGLGWWDFQSYWEQLGLGATGREAFINQLAWYDAGVRQDGYLIGFTIFTAGGFGYWENYDINPLLPATCRLRRRTAQHSIDACFEEEACSKGATFAPNLA